MNKLENALKQQLNDAQSLRYPDFEEMWDRIEQNHHTSAELSGQAESIPYGLEIGAE